MTTWAYRCEACGDPATAYYVSSHVVNGFSPQVGVVHVRAGRGWVCARLDRSRLIPVEGLVLRDVAPTDAAGCEDCRDA